MSYDRDSLIGEHMQLANDIAGREYRTAPHALKHDEMVSLAYWGLVKAANRWETYCAENKYDPSHTQYFKVFSALTIRGAIRDYIRKEDWATRTLRSKAKKLKAAGQDEGATVQELSEKTGMAVAEINKVVARLAARPVSLDAHLFTLGDSFDNVNTKRESYLEDPVDTEGSAFVSAMSETFIDTFKTLSEDVQIILALHYYAEKDLRSISQELGISETKVSQLHAYGVTAIKDSLSQAALEEEIYD
jgi:RNA polymerase sigma factor for flagellar operon FliA